MTGRAANTSDLHLCMPHRHALRNPLHRMAPFKINEIPVSKEEIDIAGKRLIQYDCFLSLILNANRPRNDIFFFKYAVIKLYLHSRGGLTHRDHECLAFLLIGIIGCRKPGNTISPLLYFIALKPKICRTAAICMVQPYHILPIVTDSAARKLLRQHIQRIGSVLSSLWRIARKPDITSENTFFQILRCNFSSII